MAKSINGERPPWSCELCCEPSSVTRTDHDHRHTNGELVRLCDGCLRSLRPTKRAVILDSIMAKSPHPRLPHRVNRR